MNYNNIGLGVIWVLISEDIYLIINVQGDKSGLGLGWVDFVLVVPLSAQNLGSQWNNQNLVNQTQSQTGLVTLYFI